MAETNRHMRARLDEEQEKISIDASPTQSDAPDEAPVKTDAPKREVPPLAASPAFGGSPTPDRPRKDDTE